MKKDSKKTVKNKGNKTVNKTAAAGEGKAALIISILAAVVYRMLIIADYASKYVDDDQALMWYGTAAAARFAVREPHFLGQAYGSMLESFVAVPFYLLGMGLNLALPIATFLLWFFPFAYCSVKISKKSRFASVIMMILALSGSWRYDILTAIPRAFIGGFFIAFIAAVFITEDKAWKKLLVLPLMSLAFTQSETTLTVSAIAVLYYLLYHAKDLKKDGKYFLISSPVAVLIYLYLNVWFYKSHPEYELHGGAQFTLSLDAFKTNMGSALKMLSDFSVLSVAGIPASLLLIVILLFIIGWFKDKKLFVVQLCAVVGSLTFFALPKTLDYTDELLFSQSRMFLFIMYVLLVVAYYFAGRVDVSAYEKHAAWAAGICMALAFIKIIYFETRAVNEDELYACSIVTVQDTKDLCSYAEYLEETMIECGCDKLVFDGNCSRALAYGSAAVSYGKYTSYIATYDRRSDLYLSLKEEVLDEDVAFMEYDFDVSDYVIYTEHVSGTNLIDYLRTEKDAQRYAEYDARYIK